MVSFAGRICYNILGIVSCIHSGKRGFGEKGILLLKILSCLADILFPRRCVLCDAPLGFKTLHVCRKCRPKLKFIEEPWCLKCGKAMADASKPYCRDCSRVNHYYTKGFAPFLYRGAMRESVVRFKYYGRGEYASFYAKAILAFGKDRLEKWRIDAVVPVPVHRQRLYKRGYNQAALAAEALSGLTGIPMDEKLVVRRVKTKAQKELDVSERRRNLFEAFALTKDRCPYERVLIVDDIYTSGSTVDAVARLLKEAGAAEVYFACICIGGEDC